MDRYRRAPAGALEYPLEAVREAVVNAVAHRDYTITVSDIELSIFADRMEIVSPGRLPNTVTVAKMRAGYRATRNEQDRTRHARAQRHRARPDRGGRPLTVRLWKQRAAVDG